MVLAGGASWLLPVLRRALSGSVLAEVAIVEVLAVLAVLAMLC